MLPGRISPLVIAAALSACAQQPIELNSERIAKQFGSYGIEVLSHANGVRRSNLYSLEGTDRVCRSYAVVRFVDENTPRVAEAHANVVAGDSIGSTFRASGWQISKITRYVGTIQLESLDHEIARLMRLQQPTRLGVHAYQLVLEKDTQTVDYATIVETHHPDYLVTADLQQLYSAEIEVPLSAEDVEALSTLILQMD